MSTPSSITDRGLPGIRAIPYGAHMCHFYRGKEDLAAALVPYFRAGLRNRERCLWITAAPLSAAEAGAALGEAGLDARSLQREGALVIRDFTDWYGNAGVNGAELLGTRGSRRNDAPSPTATTAFASPATPPS